MNKNNDKTGSNQGENRGNQGGQTTNMPGKEKSGGGQGGNREQDRK